MSSEPQNQPQQEPGTMRVQVDATAGRLSLTGPALAVVAVVLALGLIWLSGRLVDLSERAIGKTETPAAMPAQIRSMQLPIDGQGLGSTGGTGFLNSAR